MGKYCFLRKFKLQKDCYQSGQSKRVLGLVEVTCRLIHAIYSVPEWQAVKLIFFAPCRLDGVFISYFTTGLSLIKMNICQCNYTSLISSIIIFSDNFCFPISTQPIRRDIRG